METAGKMVGDGIDGVCMQVRRLSLGSCGLTVFRGATSYNLPRTLSMIRVAERLGFSRRVGALLLLGRGRVRWEVL